MSYTFEVKTTKENSEANIGDLRGSSWKFSSEEFVKVTLPYEDNCLTVTSSSGNEPDYNAVFSIKSISDVFWMILSMTASGFFQFKYNEPIEILRKVL